MKRILLVATALGLLAGGALAAPIDGDINFAGNDSYTSTAVTFIGSQNAQSDNGALGAFGTCTGCIAATSFTYSPFVGPLANLLSGTNAGVHFALDLNSVFNVNFTAGESLDFDGAAVLHLTGFDDTPGELFFSTQGPGGPVEVSFSATALPTPVPEPAALGLFGVGLLGLGFVAKRKRAA